MDVPTTLGKTPRMKANTSSGGKLDSEFNEMVSDLSNIIADMESDNLPPDNNSVECPLEAQLAEWVTEQNKNGIKQRSAEWHTARQYTVGGSTMATIQGLNPFSSIYKFISERVGLSSFFANIKPQWGNLMEDIITRYVELRLQCRVQGTDFYVLGGENTSYSPDGLAVIDHNLVPGPEEVFEDDVQIAHGRQITLLEFKCPYSRLPGGYVPKYYKPQVLMGLDLLEIPTIGLYIEAVIRRCKWEDLGNNPRCDTTLVDKCAGDISSMGILGFFLHPEKIADSMKAGKKSQEQVAEPKFDCRPDVNFDSEFQVVKEYLEHPPVDIDPESYSILTFIRDYALAYEIGYAGNDYQCNDLGDASPELFTSMMHLVDKGIITAVYYEVHLPTEDLGTLDIELQAQSDKTKELSVFNIGILPWKMFQVDFHQIEKVPNYIDPWRDVIKLIITAIEECKGKRNSVKREIIEKYVKLISERGGIQKSGLSVPRKVVFEDGL